MSKPAADPIIITHGNQMYRSSLKTHFGRGRNSIILIKDVRDGDVVSEIPLSSISPESELRIFQLVSQKWWIDYARKTRNVVEIHPPLLENFKTLVNMGLSEENALRASLTFSNQDTNVSLPEIYQEFVSTKTKIEVVDPARLNLDDFIEISFMTSVEIAKNMIESAGSNKAAHQQIYSALKSFSKSSLVGCIPNMTVPQIRGLQYLRSFIQIWQDSNDAIAIKLAKEISNEDWRRIEIIVDLLRSDASVADHIDEKDIPLWMESWGHEGISDMMKEALPNGLGHGDKLVSILMIRYGLKTLLQALKMFKNESGAGITKDLASLIHVLNFLEDKGSSDLPITWAISMGKATLPSASVEETS